jgi:Uma2 family endonuclease
MTVQLARRLFTVDDYYRMLEAGILHEDDRVELLEGEIVEMPPIGSQHVACVEKLNWLFSQRLDLNKAFIRVQDPVRLAVDTEPEPDLAIVKFREDFYRLRHPGPEEVLLLIEVADSSLQSDMEIKVPLYARAGVSEVWLVDVNSAAVTVFKQPGSDGYRTHHDFHDQDLLIPEKLPGLLLHPREIFEDQTPAPA